VTLAVLAALACSSVTAGDGVSGRSLLFIGNSLTYVNDLPAMVAKVAEAADDSVRVAMVAGPNLAVIDHVNGATDAVAQIGRGDWSFVVLQQGPTPAGVCRDTLVIAAMRLAPHLNRVGARAVLFRSRWRQPASRRSWPPGPSVVPWRRSGSPGGRRCAPIQPRRSTARMDITRRPRVRCWPR